MFKVPHTHPATARRRGPRTRPGYPDVLVNRIVAASRGRVVVQWNTGSGDTVIPTVNSTANGALIATCPKVSAGDREADRTRS